MRDEEVVRIAAEYPAIRAWTARVLVREFEGRFTPADLFEMGEAALLRLPNMGPVGVAEALAWARSTKDSLPVHVDDRFEALIVQARDAQDPVAAMERLVRALWDRLGHRERIESELAAAEAVESQPAAMTGP